MYHHSVKQFEFRSEGMNCLQRLSVDKTSRQHTRFDLISVHAILNENKFILLIFSQSNDATSLLIGIYLVGEKHCPNCLKRFISADDKSHC